MARIDLIARALTAIIAFAFLLGGILGILDNFMMKFLLFTPFIALVVYIIVILNKEETHQKT